jgi:hypothetical protein
MRPRYAAVAALALLLGVGLALHSEPAAKEKPPAPAELIRKAVDELVKMQEEDGQWAYEGVYRVGGKIPVGYRVGGTAVVADTLLHAVPDDRAARAAVAKGLAYVLKGLDDPLMAPSTEDHYDVRVWGHGCALEFLCHVRAAKAAGDQAKAVDAWVPKLVEALVTEEIDGGGWNYAVRSRHASFVTAPLTQALLLARAQGEKVPDDVLKRARKVLEASRAESGAFAYGGTKPGKDTTDGTPGSAARSAVCEVTLTQLGGSSPEALQGALDAFHKHWDELAKRRQKTGTHEGPYHIAPYYFYYGHRYAAQAIELLPEKTRAAERERLLAVILRTRDDDGTWNDRVFDRSRAYGSAMVILALLGDKTPVPPKFEVN